MSSCSDHSVELRSLLTALLDGDISTDDGRRLEQIITEDKGARQLYCRYMQLHVMLQFEQRLPRAPVEPSESAEAVLEYIRSASAKLLGRDGHQFECPVGEIKPNAQPIVFPTAESAKEGHLAQSVRVDAPPFGSAIRGWFQLPSFAFLLVAAFCGASLAWLVMSSQRAHSDVRKDATSIAKDANSRGDRQFVATLANVTSCRWDQARNVLDGDSNGLQPGQSLHLLEGVAAIHSQFPGGGVGQFQLEGPLGMILTSRGMPSLQFGKLTAQIKSDSDRFTIDTPLGRVTTEGESSIGIIASASDVEVHVFHGNASFESWSTGLEAAQPLNVALRESLRIRSEPNDTVSFEHGKAHESWFVATASMTASRLLINDHYVQTIREAHPVAYWRFEEPESKVVRNAMSDRFHCRVVGDPIRWHSYRGNHYAEFGATTEAGCLISDDTFDEVLDKHYSVEAWTKPSHFHHGTIFSLLQYSAIEPTIDFQHSMVLELVGAVGGRPLMAAGVPGVTPTWPRYPGRIRFVHRNPPGSVGGKACYSESAYALRKWQHVVCTKDESALRLYIDGKLVTREADASELAPGVRALIGQLRPHDSNRLVAERPFIGELDEIAVYDRALSAEELLSHFETVQRPNHAAAKKGPREF
jgi:hypothetical protein